MPLASRIAVDTVGGGALTAGGGQNFVRINALQWAVVGQVIASHGTGLHLNATMAAGSAVVLINGVAACRAGDLATCGHTSTGSSIVNAS